MTKNKKRKKLNKNNKKMQIMKVCRKECSIAQAVDINSALGVSLVCHPSSVFQCPLVYHTSSVLYFHSFTCTCKCLLLPQCVTNQKEHNMGLQFSQLPTPLSFSYPFLVSALQFPGSKLAAEEASLAAAVCDIRKKDSNSRH